MRKLIEGQIQMEGRKMMNFIERDPDFGYDLDAEYEYEDAQEEHDDYEEYQYEAEYAHCPGCGDEDEVLMEYNERNGRFRCIRAGIIHYYDMDGNERHFRDF